MSEIRQPRLDHDHVRALGDVESDLAQRLVGIAGIHLIGVLAARAELFRRADGLAKRTVEARRVFGGVGQDARVDQTGGLERGADGADAPIHHVGRSNHIGAGIRMRARLAHQGFDREVVLDVAGVVDQTVLTVRRERIESHIGDDAEARKLLFDRPHRLLGNAVGIPGFARVQRLFFSAGTTGNSAIAGIRSRTKRCAFAQQFVDREPLDAGHRGDRLALLGALDHEHRINQRVRA